MAQVWIAIEFGHQNVAEDELGLVVIDLGQGIEAIVGKKNSVTTLFEENFSAAADGVAVIHDQNAQRRTRCSSR